MPVKWIVLGLAVLMYALIVTFPDRKSWSALGAALLMILVRALTPGDTIFSLVREAGTELINWDVLMIFVGSLVIAELFIYSRVPAAIADSIVNHSPNVGVAMVLILIMTGIISAFVENVATVLVMAPIALALCNKLKLNPGNFMVGLAVMANLEGTATLVGDPPSMIFADYANYGFNDFFVYQGKLSIFFAVQAGLIVGALFFYRIFAKNGGKKVDVEKETIRSMVPAWLLILMILGLAGASFFYGGISLASGLIVIVLALAGIIWYRWIRKESSARVLELVKGLDWDTVFFLIGIFVVVGAVASVGLLEDFAAFLARVVGSNVLLGFVLILGVSTLISGFVDNVPYIIVMLPVAASLARELSLKPELYLFALLVGSCMGGNLTPFGASANVVSVGILRKQNVRLSFVQWLKIGLPFTVLTTSASALFLWIVWRG
ncbi:MAG: TRAP transporter large permease subunit [Spirochaetaceae bacterium]|jgi:Na+/H+ antiporter NhaD/arsenite permease-like protein|nr:TRAP transporter large permease subunit [Spirochaetaceae bacterium]